jgi:NTE family protein
MLVLPDDLEKYGINPEEFEIAKAVRMSASIPFYFTPYILNYRGGKSCIVDGGLLSNFPIWIFDVEGLPRWPTFGLRLEQIKEPQKIKRCNLYRFTKSVISAPININGERFIRDKDLIRTITIKYKDIYSTDFQRANNCKDELYKLGFDYTEGFINKWDFKRYIKMRTAINS